MPIPAPSQLLRRHVAPFAVSSVALTTMLVANFVVKRMAALSGRGADGGVAEAALLAVPFTLAMTIPMAVFVAVLWVFTRLGREGTLAKAWPARDGVRRLLMPVLAGAAVISVLMGALNTQAVPRANARLAGVLASGTTRPSDRTMTIAELRRAAANARTSPAAGAEGRAATYEVEIHKKYALAAACVFLALAAAALAIRFPRGGWWLFAAAPVPVFTTYYVTLVAGESLADRLVLSPSIAMWLANALALALALLAVATSRPPGVPHRGESIAVNV